MTYHPPVAPRLSGSILYTLIAVFSLTLITACGGVSLDANLNITDARTELCKANPYATACRNDEDYAAARKEVFDSCIADSTTDLCATVIPIVCDDNPFSALCVGDQKYLTERDNITTACEARTCTAPQLVHFCTDNPYHARCIGEAAYHTNRADILATCSTNPDGTNTGHRHCDAAVAVCENNPFDTLCLVGDNYTLVRTSTINICIDNNGPGLTSQFCANAIEATCVGEGITDNPALCANAVTGTVADTCDADIFNSSCDNSPTYIGQRIAFCQTTPGDDRCAPVVSGVCTTNPFHALCLAGNTYVTPRNTAITGCINNSQGPLCANATVHACGINPFHVLCYDSSATAFQAARQTAVTECGDGTNVITTQLCTDAVLLTCEGDSADTFNAICGAYSGQAAQTTACGDNDAATRCYLQEQIDRCADGRETARCAQVGTGDISTCTADPFAAACVVAGSTFATYLADAQTKRYTYCGETTRSTTDPICASYRACNTALNAGTPVPDGCGTNFDATLRDTCEATPFDPQCTASVFNSNKRDFCSTNDVTKLFHTGCTADYRDDTARNSFCESNPFDTNCKSNVAYADEREDNCAGPSASRHASCVTPLLNPGATKVTLIDPRGGTQITDRYNDSFLSIEITQDDAIAPVLAPIIRDIVTPAVTETVPVPEGSPEGTEPTTRVVTEAFTTPETAVIGPINVGRRGGAGRPGTPNNNPDGYAFFTLLKPGSAAANLRTSHHVAILPTTNLGAPLTQAPMTAVWPGHFSTTENGIQQAVDFFIKFNPATGGGQINFSNSAGTDFGLHPSPNINRLESRPGIASAAGLRLDVNFDSRGVLVRSFAEARDTTQNPLRFYVTGLIGQEGVVAVFTTRDVGDSGAGGFTASNPDHRNYVEAYVEADLNVEETGADSNAILVNYEDWTESFAAPATAPSAPSKSEFLQTNNRRLRDLANGQNAQVAAFTTNIAAPDPDNPLLYRGSVFRSWLVQEGPAKNGFAATNGFAVQFQPNNYYAGVFNTADLGAPITTRSGSALWRGYLVVQNGTATIRRLFDLTVTFASNHGGQVGELSSSAITDTNTPSSGLLHTIEGRFNARGALSGIVRRTTANGGLISAPLSGIIGQYGTIGVFVSDEENNKFAGGFVAVPYQAPTAVTYGDVWKASHDAGKDGLFATPQGYNHWLEGGVAGTNGQSVAGIDAGTHNGGILRLSTGSWKRVLLGGEAADGVAFYTGIRTNIGRRFFSGITSGTDLGKPVTSKAGATWTGQLSTRQHIGNGNIRANYGDITLTVRYNETGGTISGGLSANPLTSPNYTYEIRGRFNEDGLVEGNVNTRTSSGGFEPGFLSGLIGEQGIVGAFIAPNVAGGFVARPGVPEFASVNVNRVWQPGGVVDYQNWLYAVQVNGSRLLADRPHNVTGRLNEFLLTAPHDTTNHFISWGDSRSDDGRERIAVGVEDAWGDQGPEGNRPPSGLTGGFSALHTLWNPRDGLSEQHTGLHRAYHAGIHPDTNVGTILPRIPLGVPGVVATWKAKMSIIGNKTFDYKITTGSVSPIDVVNVEFQMEVHLDNRTLKTPSHTATYRTINGHWYNLQARWDDRGVITGTFQNSHANFPDADVTGLVGTNGAVAAMVSKFNRTYGYAGGFIACPTPKLDGTGNCK